VRYVKQKRDKIGPCTICKEIRELTFDHIPPSSAGNVSAVMLTSAMSAISGRPQEDRPLISQNGYKIRSICSDCNSTLGREYDPAIAKLCAAITNYLESPLSLPAQVAFDTKPARLLRGILAHLLAAKLSPDTCLVDQQIREFLSDHTHSLGANVHLYYWLYPYPQIFVLRDFGTVFETGDGRKSAFCSVMKFPPLAMLLSDIDYFHDLPDLASMSHFSIDDPGHVHVRFRDVKPRDWPEGTDHSGFILMGDAGTQSIHGAPRNG
jgi:hypothetical protein